MQKKKHRLFEYTPQNQPLFFDMPHIWKQETHLPNYFLDGLYRFRKIFIQIGILQVPTNQTQMQKSILYTPFVDMPSLHSNKTKPTNSPTNQPLGGSSQLVSS